jgi:outer membrane protein
MFLKTIPFISILFFCLVNRIAAQEGTPIPNPAQWNLVQCIDYAKKNNIQINSLRLSQQISQQQYLLAKAARLPNLTGSASQNFEHANASSSYNNSGYNVANGSSFTTSGVYSLNSSVVLYNGSYINNTIAQANLSVNAANLNILQLENDITLQITQAYLIVLLDKENIVYDSTLVVTDHVQVQREQKIYDVGSVALYALIQLKAQESTDQFTLVKAINTQKADLLTLKQLLLITSDEKFDIIKPETIAPIDSISTFKSVEQIALSSRPEIKNGEQALQIAQYGVSIARAGYKPLLTAGGSLNTSYFTGQGNLATQLNNNFNQQLGLTLAIPIFTRRVVKTQVEEAKINVDQAGLNLSDTKITLSQTVERAFLNVANAKSQYEAALVQYNLNKEGYRIASEQLKVGAANMVDFLLQKNLFIQAQQAYIQSKYNELLTLKVYDFYRGIPIKL